ANNTFSDADVTNPFDDLIVFGDSLSDTGNAFEASGNTAPASPPYFEGRFSNGLVWIEYFAQEMEFSEESIRNFAFGGAKTGESELVDPTTIPGLETQQGLITIPGLLTQIDQFEEEIVSNPVSENSLYMIWIGSNDVLDIFADPEVVVPNAINNISNAITRLSNLGAEEIVIANLTDLGATPLITALGNTLPFVDPEEFRATSITFNKALSEEVNQLETSLNIDLPLVDIFAFNEEVQDDVENSGGEEYGFTNITEPLLNAGDNVNPDEYAFFDQVHPTTRLHQFISQTFLETLVEEETITDFITYSANLADDSELPDWLEFNSITRTFDGTPTDENIGTLDIKVTATDQEGLIATDTFSLVIEDTTPAIVTGTPEADTKIAGIDFDGTNNIIFTGAENDLVESPFAGSLAGKNRIATGSGDDIIFVADGDRAFGGSGGDILDATDASNYRLSGGSGNDTFYLGENGRALGGDGEDDFFVQEDGNNIIAGGEGADKFWVANVSLPISQNTITDFTIGVDKIHFSGFENLGFDGITREQIGADTLLKLDTTEVALLVGINANSITANDFDFAATIV
ncbi:MAG: hypothetical protein F6K62_21245, partial [Sphaerospermopsis sp. SIO1G2]|nr:hypothetical protein [Sphaerospermopsis sp. SIO1G2]